jgi:hypothetical protein
MMDGLITLIYKHLPLLFETFSIAVMRDIDSGSSFNFGLEISSPLINESAVSKFLQVFSFQLIHQV